VGEIEAPGAIYYDITWVGYIGTNPPVKYKKIFTTSATLEMRRSHLCRIDLRPGNHVTDGKSTTFAVLW